MDRNELAEYVKFWTKRTREHCEEIDADVYRRLTDE